MSWKILRWSPFKQTVVFLIVGLLIGMGTAYILPQTTGDEMFTGIGEQLAERLPQSSQRLEMFRVIFVNNLRISLLIVLSGIVTNLIPVGILTANGVVLGFVSAYVGRQMGFLFVLLLLLPHGVFEFPALIISGIIGVQLTFDVRQHFKERDWEGVAKQTIIALRKHLIKVVPLLLVAAFVESWLISLV